VTGGAKRGRVRALQKKQALSCPLHRRRQNANYRTKRPLPLRQREKVQEMLSGRNQGGHHRGISIPAEMNEFNRLGVQRVRELLGFPKNG
jgi:hypothetical protein